MKATIVYYSHKGKTAYYAREMAMYLWSKGVSVSLCSISDFDSSKLEQTDLLLMGCWTSGWFVIGQHPHTQWKQFARSLPGRLPDSILLFTTYKIRTGSMFRRMKKAAGIPRSQVGQLQSRTGRLSDADKALLDSYLKNHNSNN